MAAPPPPPPPGPAFPAFSAKSNAGDDGRSMLLQSIRQGTKLKKTVTNDKSAPAIGGGSKPSSNTSSGATARTSTNSRPSNEAPPSTGGLGGLFVNGIPKLKPTGSAIGQAYQQYRNENDAPKSNPSVNNKISSNTVNNSYSNHNSTSSVTKTRGPPPQPPGFPPKIVSSDADTTNGLPLHSRSGSAISLSDNSYQNRDSDDGHHPHHKHHVFSHGKPSLAPKPPTSITVSAKPDRLVSRAQSMRVKSSISTNEVKHGNQSDPYRINNKNGLPLFHQSQESLSQSRRNNGSTSPSRTPSNAVSWGSSINNPHATLRPHHRSHASTLRPPQAKPPPPPSNRNALSPPMCPPPPPPTHAPPPPPHRLNPAPPPPPSVVQNRLNNNISNFGGAPPTPPVRNSSMRNSNPGKMSSFESRFKSLFHSVEEFPPPQPFQDVPKLYNSRVQQAKSQAPQPPGKLQSNRMWQPCESASNC